MREEEATPNTGSECDQLLGEKENFMYVKYGIEEKKTGETVNIYGVPCEKIKWRWAGSKSRFRIAFRFTVPGWTECTIDGVEAAERVIRGRLNAAVRNTMGI